MLEKVKAVWAWLLADKKRLIGAGIALVIIAAGSWKVLSGNTAKPQYQTTAVTRGTIVSSVSASGQILTSNLVNVSTQATGVVKNVYVKNGDRVYAGEKIADVTLDGDGVLANVKAWASLVSAQVAFNAANNNYRATQASVQNVYDQVKGHDSDETPAQKDTRTKAEVANDNAYDATKTAQANLVSAGAAYGQTSPVVVAPMAGIVDNVTITSGMVMVGSNRVAVVRSLGNPIAAFNVSEVDVNRIEPGQKATVTLDSISDKTFTGKVMTVDKIGTVSSGVTNYPVVILLDSGAPEILPNMAATANIIVASKDNVLLVPSEAVQTSGGVNTVRVLKNGQPQETAVELGLSSDTQTEIISGVSEGDEVITGVTSGAGASRSSTATSPFSTFRIGGAGGGLRTSGTGR